MKVKELKDQLRAMADPEISTHSQRFFKTGKGEYGEGDRFLGIRVPILRKLVPQCRAFTLKQSLNLLKSPFHEERLLALLILVDHFKRADQETQAVIYEAYLAHTLYINSWDLVDSSAPQIVGAYLEDKKRSVLYRLVKSDILWERRIAMIATYHFIKRDSFDDALKIATQLLNDQEDLIHKAVGWMLREIGKRDIEIEKGFLDRYAAMMPRTMLRYAIEKLPAAKRKHYLTRS